MHRADANPGNNFMTAKKKRILIVDDEASFTRLLKLNFHHTGRYVAEVVNDASRAVEAADRFGPDMILLDVMMPGLDGGEVASRIHARAKLKDVPILFLTAAVKREELGMDGTVGGIPFLAKPVDFQEVVEHIEKECRRNHPVPV